MVNGCRLVAAVAAAGVGWGTVVGFGASVGVGALAAAMGATVGLAGAAVGAGGAVGGGAAAGVGAAAPQAFSRVNAAAPPARSHTIVRNARFDNLATSLLPFTSFCPNHAVSTPPSYVPAL